MTNLLVKILIGDYGDVIESPVWHLVDPDARMGDKALCTQEFYGEGESVVKFKLKTVNRGVPCEKCREIIEIYRSVKL